LPGGKGAYRLDAVAGLDDLVVRVFEDVADAQSEERLVVDDENPRPRRRRRLLLLLRQIEDPDAAPGDLAATNRAEAPVAFEGEVLLSETAVADRFRNGATSSAAL